MNISYKNLISCKQYENVFSTFLHEDVTINYIKKDRQLILLHNVIVSMYRHKFLFNIYDFRDYRYIYMMESFNIFYN